MMFSRYACFRNRLPVTADIFNFVGYFLPDAMFRDFRTDCHPINAFWQFDATVSFNRDLESCRVHCRQHVVINLQPGFSAGQDNPTTTTRFRFDPLHQFIHCHFSPACKLGVAIKPTRRFRPWFLRALQIASGESDKNICCACSDTFALDRQKHFVYFIHNSPPRSNFPFPTTQPT